MSYRITEYTIAEGGYAAFLDSVRNLIAQGWAPHGGVSVSTFQKYDGPDGTYYGKSNYKTVQFYTQSMVKYGP